MTEKIARLTWKPVKRPELVGLSKEHLPFLFPDGLFLLGGRAIGVGEKLRTQVLEDGAWRDLEGCEEAWENVRQPKDNHVSLVVEPDRVTAVTGCGCVFELLPGKPWTLLHRPESKESEKLHEAAVARDPRVKRLVAFRGFTWGEAAFTNRARAQRTHFLDKGEWRLSKQAPEDPNPFGWMQSRLFFDVRFGIVRLWGDGLGVLEKDSWTVAVPEGFELPSWLASGYAPLADGRSLNLLLLEGNLGVNGWEGDGLTFLSFDLERLVPLAKATPAPGARIWDPNARSLLVERAGRTWALDLKAYFAKLSPKAIAPKPAPKPALKAKAKPVAKAKKSAAKAKPAAKPKAAAKAKKKRS